MVYVALDLDLSYQTGMSYDDRYKSTQGTTSMTIDARGNVGIGTTSPDRKLEILDSSNTTINDCIQMV